MLKAINVKSQSDKESNDRKVKAYKSQMEKVKWTFRQIRLHLVGIG